MRRGVWLLATVALAVAPVAGAIGPYYIEFQARLIDHNNGPVEADCILSIVPGWSISEVLHNATMNFCTTSWSGDGSKVNCINGLCSQTGWRIYVNDTRHTESYLKVHVYGNETVVLVWTDDGGAVPKIAAPTIPATPDVPDVPPTPTPPSP